MCGFKREMPALKRLIDLKAFYLSMTCYHHNGNTRKNRKNSVKSKNYPEKTMRELQKNRH